MGVGLWPDRTDTLVPADVFTSRLTPTRRGETPPKEWRDWLKTLFPAHFTHPLAQRHIDLWKWVISIKLGQSTNPFVALWPRGGGKSTSAEAAAVALGVRGRRKYVLYVRMTQPMADKSVSNIAGLLESKTITRFYPEHADRKVGKFGNSKGWRREQLRTAGGFTVDALGLDAAARGTKVEEQRPDLIIFDDIDALDDGPAATKKKIDIITKSILPAGSNDVAVLFIQNVIIRDGVAAQLADGRADFLAQRVVSGPFKALEGFQHEWQLNPKTGIKRAVITDGTPTWDGQDLAACQTFIDLWGLAAFVKEAQHEVQGKAAGVSLDFDQARHYTDLTDEQVIQLAPVSKAFAGIDFGAWRFGFTLFFAPASGPVIRVNEFFSQREGLAARAQRVHDLVVASGFDDPTPMQVPIWGDAANPQDIMEMNLAFVKMGSKLRVVAVANENKLRKVAVDRINNLLAADALKFRRSVAADSTWMLGMNAGSPGTELAGSRLMWEIDNWAVPLPKEGEAQDQNPDDDTADGADMIAAMRYALMSWWRAAKMPTVPDVIPDDKAERFNYQKRQFEAYPHAADDFDPFSGNGRSRPQVRAPRPRIGRP